ncbi:MAG TPA: hypothetical protein VK841_07355 [Polyangiaceae bacterium]|nr:hypothetical protein [Polyangiaceae bacterium]
MSWSPLPPGFAFDVEGPIAHPERGPIITLRVTGPADYWRRLVLPVSNLWKIRVAAVLLAGHAWTFANRQAAEAPGQSEGGR